MVAERAAAARGDEALYGRAAPERPRGALDRAVRRRRRPPLGAAAALGAGCSRCRSRRAAGRCTSGVGGGLSLQIYTLSYGRRLVRVCECCCSGGQILRPHRACNFHDCCILDKSVIHTYQAYVRLFEYINCPYCSPLEPLTIALHSAFSLQPSAPISRGRSLCRSLRRAGGESVNAVRMHDVHFPHSSIARLPLFVAFSATRAH